MYECAGGEAAVGLYKDRPSEEKKKTKKKTLYICPSHLGLVRRHQILKKAVSDCDQYDMLYSSILDLSLFKGRRRAMCYG